MEPRGNRALLVCVYYPYRRDDAETLMMLDSLTLSEPLFRHRKRDGTDLDSPQLSVSHLTEKEVPEPSPFLSISSVYQS